MAKRYNASIQLRCWKQHTCASCGTYFTYILDRKVTAQAGTADKANALLQKNYVKTQQTENDMQPCPTCGHYQQDMLGLRLGRKRGWVFFASLLMPILVPILKASNAIQANTLALVAAIYCVIMLGWELLLGLSNSNGNLEANRQLAQQRVAAGTLHFQPAEVSAVPQPLTHPARSMGITVSLGLLALCILLSFVPEINRSIHGWPLNEDTYPPVVGPNDTARVYMDHSIHSVKSYWRGEALVKVNVPGVDKPLDLKAATNQNDWGNTISAKPSEKDSSSTPWVDITFPNDSALADKTVTCHITLNIEYPQASGNTFSPIQEKVNRDITIHLAKADAGNQYNSTWWMFILSAIFGVSVISYILMRLARAYTRTALPATTAPLEQPKQA